MVIALALGSALTYGAADFWGGLASRRAPSAAVVVTAQMITLPVVLGWLLLSPAAAGASDLLWGAVSGVAGAGGVLFLYRGLADGRMSVVAPLTGLVAAGIPVIASPLLGEVPPLLSLCGIILALAAIALVSREPNDLSGAQLPVVMSRSAMVAMGMASGTCFGALFLMLDQTTPASGLWPLVTNKATAIVVVGVFGLWISRSGLRVPRPALPAVLACAAAGTAAEILFLLSVQRGLVAIAAVLTSLYPGSTVLLARFVLHERLRPDQVAGFALAGVAVGLIALG